MSQELVCITCPMGCRLTVDTQADGSLEVSGNRCARGIKYANEELLAPKRMVSATARIAGAGHEALDAIARLPVRTTLAYPKEGVAELLAAIYALDVKLPVKRGATLIKDFKGSGVDVIAARTLS
jgi:CxxC motif-containing protein